jgi:hypothetical protein
MRRFPSKSQSEPSSNRWRKPVVGCGRSITAPAAAASAPVARLAAAAGKIFAHRLTPVVGLTILTGALPNAEREMRIESWRS